ncbi:MAG TPA: NAD-dependent epimerase/dehydratase family protein [Thermoanaerobaculia bacterium]|nr:NAD-dependent epimerase/dehydratase family protein [Thermoanaerobaculia bacterium]
MSRGWSGLRVLVTGGAGFVGSHLVEELLARGATRVAVLDDLSTGRPENLEPARLEAGGGELELRVGSVLDRALVDELVRDADAVLHLAAVVGVRRVMERPRRCIEVNVHGAESVLEACARWRRPVLVTSSSEVYGRGGGHRLSEGDRLSIGPPDSPRWVYATAKLLGEQVALALHREQGLPVVVTRLFNTVGPRQRVESGMVIPRFVAQAVRGEPITVHGTGRQARTFLDVRDCVRALAALALHPEAAGRVFNVGGRDEIEVGALAERVRERAGSSAEILRTPHSETFGPGFEDVERRRPDLTRLDSLLEWSELRGLDAILDELIELERSSLAGGASAPELAGPAWWAKRSAAIG